VPTLSHFTARSIGGDQLPLARYAGQVVLVVNTASKCGLTPQYEALQSLYEKYAPRGLIVLGFPCDQFGNQEPGDEAAIDDFCKLNFGVTFPLFAKVDVNGEQAHPLYRWLREEQGGALGDAIKWNFTKFLISRDGTVLKRYAPTTTPDKIAQDIEDALDAPASGL
jgi:glutathione peroxidase